MKPLHLSAVLLAVTLWGLSFIAVKWSLESVTPLTLSMLRFGLAGLPLLWFVPRPRSPWVWIALYGLVGFALMFMLLFAGIAAGMPAGLASLVIQVQVFFTIGFAALFAGQRPQRLQLIASALAASGVALVGWGMQGGASRLGLALVLGAAAAWASGNLLVRRIADDPLATVAWASSFAAVALALACAAIEGPSQVLQSLLAMPLRGWSGVAFQAWPATIVAFGIWARLLRLYPAALVAPFALLVPIVGIASTSIVLGETMNRGQWAGAVLVLLGLGLNVLSFRSRGPVASDAAPLPLP